MAAELGAAQKSEPNVVPLCDILLVLLIIFMVITPMAQMGIDVKLPESGSEGDSTGKSEIVLTLNRDMSVLINREPTTVDMLSDQLRNLFQIRVEKRLFIRADEKIPYKDVLEVIDIAKGAGVDVIGVVTSRYASE